MGHVDNIVAMFHREPDYHKWTGKILDDERFNVRLGVSVLFEELKNRKPDRTDLAIPSLLPLLQSSQANIRGEAVSVLAIIGGLQVQEHIRKMTTDTHPQVKELALELLAELGSAVASDD